MTDEKPKKKRRPDSEVLADLQARAARLEWKGPRRAVEIMAACAEHVEEAHAACAGKIQGVDELMNALLGRLTQLKEAIHAAIPPEAK